MGGSDLEIYEIVSTQIEKVRSDKQKRDQYTYRFYTDSSLNYQVEFVPITSSWYEVQFNVVGNSVTEVTNRGEVFRILSTVIHLIKETVSKLNKETVQVQKISFQPTSKGKYDTENVGKRQRFKLYKLFIENSLNQSVWKEGENIFFNVPENGFD